MRDFSGNQALTTIATTVITNALSFTLAWWMYRVGTPGAQSHIVRTSDGAGRGWQIDLTTGNLIYALIDSSGNPKVRTSTSSPALNGLTHLAVRHQQTGNNSTDFTFFVNGVLEAGSNTSTMTGTRGSAALAMIIGDDAQDPQYRLGPLSFFERAVSPAAIMAMAAGANPQEFWPTVTYPMDKINQEPDVMRRYGLTVVNQTGHVPTLLGGQPPIEKPSPLILSRRGVRPYAMMRESWDDYGAAAAAAALQEDYLAMLGQTTDFDRLIPFYT